MRGLAIPDIKMHFIELYDLNAVFQNCKQRNNLMEQNQNAEIDHGAETYVKDDVMGKKKIKEIIFN